MSGRPLGRDRGTSRASGGSSRRRNAPEEARSERDDLPQRPRRHDPAPGPRQVPVSGVPSPSPIPISDALPVRSRQTSHIIPTRALSSTSPSPRSHSRSRSYDTSPSPAPAAIIATDSSTTSSISRSPSSSQAPSSSRAPSSPRSPSADELRSLTAQLNDTPTPGNLAILDDIILHHRTALDFARTQEVEQRERLRVMSLQISSGRDSQGQAQPNPQPQPQLHQHPLLLPHTQQRLPEINLPPHFRTPTPTPPQTQAPGHREINRVLESWAQARILEMYVADLENLKRYASDPARFKRAYHDWVSDCLTAAVTRYRMDDRGRGRGGDGR